MPVLHPRQRPGNWAVPPRNSPSAPNLPRLPPLLAPCQQPRRVAATGKVSKENTTHDFADSYSTVIALAADQLRPVPEFSSTIGSNHLLAIGSVADRMLILLDIDKLRSSPEMGLVAETVQ